MNITLSGTKVSMDGHTLAFQKNNLVDSMVITVDTDETWQYKLDVKYPCKDSDGKELYNVIDLTRVGNTCTAILQASMLPFNGKYTMQLRGISGDKVYHTDTFDVWVKYSIDPGKVYDPVPSEFYQIEQAVTEEAANAKQSATESAESARQAAASREAIENMEVAAVSLPPDSDATVEKSLVDDKVKLTFGIPKGEKGESGAEQFVVTVTDAKSDKTPAEITEAVKAGKQVVLQDSSVGVVQSCCLVNAGNDVATFCGTEQMTDGTADLDSIFSRNWYSILGDKTVIHAYDFNIPFYIGKYDSSKYTSSLSPELLALAAESGCAVSALLTIDGENFLGTIKYFDAEETIHIYFPDYAKGKVYDLKWNEDENPSTYTFTELSLSGEEPLVVTFTPTYGSSISFKADISYDDIKKAANAGRIVYAFVQVAEDNIFGQLTEADSSSLIFRAFSGNDRIMIITMKSDSDISCMLKGTLSYSDSIDGSGQYDAGYRKIVRVHEPTDPSDAATKDYVDKNLGSSDLSLGLTAATVGQTIKVKAIDAEGKPTEWEAVDMPTGGETWEKIAEIVIPEGADESTALAISKDFDGNPFSLVKARLCAKFPKYTGATTIPNFSFAMLNGKTTGRVTPLAYTSVWPKVSASIITGMVYEIDVSGAQQIEHVIKSINGGWSDDSSRDYVLYGATPDTDTTWFGDTLWAKPITSIGGIGMLIYPGCRFVLYGVRA